MKYSLLLVVLLLQGCESSYRYPCQDPENWNKTECNDETCDIDKTCTKDLLNQTVKSETIVVEEKSPETCLG